MDIRIVGLTKRYRGHVTALDDIDLTIPTGMFGLLGANGAGKTTLMRLLAGILTPTRGTIHVGGVPMTSTIARRRVQRTLGYLPQDLGLYPDLTARAFLDYIAVLKGISHSSARRRQINRLLDTVALTEVANRKIAKLSGGMKRRLGIAQALLGDPSLLIVDEPTAGLDPEERTRFRTLLSNLAGDRTVLLSTHIVEDIAATTQRLAVLGSGKVRHVGDVDSLTALATGRTWILDLPVGSAPPAGHTPVAARNTGRFISYRLITDQPPAGSRPAEPTLEDGYIALVREPLPAIR